MRSGGERLHAAFDRLRRGGGKSLAILDAGERRAATREDLAREVDRVAAALAPGGRAPRIVAVQMQNGVELVATVLACWRIGAVPMPLDAELVPVEVAACCGRLGLSRVLRAGSTWEDLAVEPAADAVLPAGTALLKVTSGSTGEPRAVAVSADALESGIAQICSTMGITAGDRSLIGIPLAHSYGFDNAVLALAAVGSPMVLVRDLVPRSVIDTGARAAATVLPAVPLLIDVLARGAGRGGAAWPELRLVISAGAPLPVPVRERFAARFGLRPRTFYGATECGGIAFDREGQADLPEGCVGAPVDGVEIELVDEEDGVGRIRVRSRSAASGYVVPRAADPALGAGAYLTPDVGRLDERGRVHLLGRSADVINVGGRKVYPAEVERVIRAIPGVRDVAVLALARSSVAEALRAVVAADGRVDRAAVVAACARSLARYKVPRVVELVSELPRTARGKLDRRRLGT